MKITVVTTMRNEGAHLLEWLAHHRAAGVDDFVVYVNNCEDGSEALLSLLPGVHLIVQDDSDKPPQWRALRAAWDHPAVVAADWLICMDCDEFVNLGKGLASLPDLIQRIGGDAITLPWRFFGHAGRAELTDLPTTEAFAQAAPVDLLYPAIASYFKTLFRREGPFRQFGVHRPKQKQPARHGLPVWHDGSGALLPEPLAANDAKIMNWGAPLAGDLVQLNHYSTRSAADFMVKRARGLPNHTQRQIDLTYWVERNFNAVEDTRIAAMRPATAAVEAEFLAIPGVAQAQQACRDWRARRFAQALQNDAELKLYGRLLLAGSSKVLPGDQQLALIRAYQSLPAHG